MKFSVIIPVYNKVDYVKKAVESVLAQTYSDYELIIVDDGSTDGSGEICDNLITPLPLSLSASHPTIRIIHQANAGVAAARNNGVAASHGEYVAFLDADDWWASTYLERMMWLIENYPDAGIYACNYWYVKTGKTRVGVSKMFDVSCMMCANDWQAGYINYPKTYYENGGMPVWTGATIMPRKIFDEMNGFPVGICLGEDFLLWSKTALKYKVAFLNEPLTYYNNDIPAKLRATRNLHAPEKHMLFRMEHLAEAEATNKDWKAICDSLRVGGLLEYWMDQRYHEVAAKELEKVDWSKQSARVMGIYKTPIWILKAKRSFMQVGSWCKQKLINLKIRLR